MNTAIKSSNWLSLWCVTAVVVTGAAAAQEAVPATAPAPSPSAATPIAPKAAPAAGATVKPSRSTAQMDAGEPRAKIAPTPAVGQPASDTPTTPRAPAEPAASTPAASQLAGAHQKTPGGTDRLNLGTATVTGDREQPKVMYIVPWKKPDIGDLSGKPMSSLLDEVLAPVDREEFKREVAYYDAVKSDAAQSGAASPAKPLRSD